MGWELQLAIASINGLKVPTNLRFKQWVIGSNS